MTKAENSLLLYFEARATDHCGTVDRQQMNDEDREIAERWDDEGFVKYGMFGVVLSDEAIDAAHQLRKERIRRNEPGAVEEPHEH